MNSTGEGDGDGKVRTSIESARRFLYDEDEELPALPANTPISDNTAFPSFPTARSGSTQSKSKRVNPFAAACLSTLSTFRGYGCKRLCFIISGTALLLVCVWGIVIAARDKRSKETANPHRIRDIQSRILEIGLSEKEILETPGTPQFHAVRWLANLDQTNTGDPYLVQRYILAVLFYSTSGTEEHISPLGRWNNQKSWMTSSGFCGWVGVECELDPKGPTFDGNGVVTSLNLTLNGLAGSLPSELEGLEGLLRLDLSDNALVGTLPKSLGNLKNLLDMILRNNELSGYLPSEYGVGFRSLRQLSLGVNKLKGYIPKEIQHMTNLLALGLEGNEFAGHVPDLEDLQKLTRLYLESNKLEGPFPESVTRLTSLVELNLSQNHLTGYLPSEIEKLTRLGMSSIDYTLCM
jgi:hypothetical protein